MPSEPVENPGSQLERLLSHIDPEPAEESEAFVRRIYEQRHIDVSGDFNGKTGR